MRRSNFRSWRPENSSAVNARENPGERTFHLLIEMVEQTLLLVLRDDFERGRREKVAHAILDFIWEQDVDSGWFDVMTRRCRRRHRCGGAVS